MLTDTHLYAAKDELKCGTEVIIRAIRKSDKDVLQQIMRDVSAESRYFRFFCAKKQLTTQELRYFTEIDCDEHMGLIVSLCDEDETPIAVGRYIKQTELENAGSAELALLVREDFQRQGIGNLLLEHLANIATTKGISEFVCFIMSENSKMQSLLKGSRYPVRRQDGANSIVRFSVDLTQRSSA
jgi:acetyltransferase